jgi:thiamine pyrophosphate-dependent acetolactate synthase large subunit-like protein
MELADALRVLHEVRTDEVVLTSMGTGRDWQQFEPHPLDFIQIPSSMGQTPSWGLGIALAQPQRRVVACCGDGSLLMNLGSLVTIANVAPANLTLLVFDNGVYEVTGGQPTPAATARRLMGQPIDLASIAHQCGFRHTEHISDLDQWRQRADELLTLLGPVCAVLDVAPVREDYSVRSPGPPRDRIRQFTTALQSSIAGERGM